MTDGCLPLGQMVEDGAAGGIGQCVEDLIKIMFNHVVEYICIWGDVQPIGSIFLSSLVTVVLNLGMNFPQCLYWKIVTRHVKMIQVQGDDF